MEKSLTHWIVFFVVALSCLIIDLKILHSKDKKVSLKESLRDTGFYFLVAIAFGFWIYYEFNFQSFVEYLTGFLIEKTLALDNIFVISVIFTALSIPEKYRHRVLFFGILGVIFSRAIFIWLGSRLVKEFDWTLYIFSLFMVFTGIKIFFSPKRPIEIEKNPFLLWARRNLRISPSIEGNRFFVKLVDPLSGTSGIYATPLFLALLIIESVDLIFALDSVPAIFTITQDPYIIYTSNIFAILGLRSLYFSLAFAVGKFYYLKFSLGAVLVFIGSKIFIADFFGMEKFPPEISLAIVFIFLTLGFFYSLKKKKTRE